MRIASAEGSPGWKTVRPLTPEKSRHSSKGDSDSYTTESISLNNGILGSFVAPNGPNRGDEKELWCVYVMKYGRDGIY